MRDLGVQLARPVLPGRGVGQAEQVDVGAIVARIADLAAGQERLQDQRAAERQGDVRVRGRRQAVVHQLGDEAGDSQQRFR